MPIKLPALHQATESTPAGFFLIHEGNQHTVSQTWPIEFIEKFKQVVDAGIIVQAVLGRLIDDVVMAGEHDRAILTSIKVALDVAFCILVSIDFYGMPV
jgi:hypothetical protein